MPKDINPAEIMLNNLTEKSESLTGHNPLDIRKDSNYFVFDFTEDKDVNERLKLRVSTDHVKTDLSAIDQIVFSMGIKINIGIITNNTDTVKQVVERLTKKENNFTKKTDITFLVFVL